MTLGKIKFIDEAKIQNSKVLLRVDFNVARDSKEKITDDFRIRQTLPTILHLLKNNNKLILVSHLDDPQGRDPKHSLAPVAKRLGELLKNYKIRLVSNFTSGEGKSVIDDQTDNEIIFLENIRFYQEEKNNDLKFAKQLARLADIFVNDAFGVSHRKHASVVGVCRFLPSYGGPLLKKEVETIKKVLEKAKKPFVSIVGGAKISSKINLLSKLLKKTDYLLLGGGIANTFLLAQGVNIGKSLAEKPNIQEARQLLALAKRNGKKLLLPIDAAIKIDNKNGHRIIDIKNIPLESSVLDIGTKTQSEFAKIIAKARTILWNGPLGYFEDERFAKGTNAIYKSIIKNNHALSIVGGGDTIAAIAKNKNLDRITLVSTGGGAMLELIEKDTLPGLEALKQSI